MHGLLFSREVIRGAGLAALLLTGILVGYAFHQPGSADTQEPPPQAITVAPSAAQTPAEALNPTVIAAETAPPAPHIVPPPPPLTASQPPARRTGVTPPRKPAVNTARATIREVEEAPEPEPEPRETAVAVEEKAAASAVEQPAAAPSDDPSDASADDASGAKSNRGVRWIKSFGRRIRILPRK